MSILILTAYIAVWGFIHSVLASLGFKFAFRQRFGTTFYGAYRFLYNVFSFFSFVPVLVLMHTTPDHGVYSVPAPWSFLMVAGQVLALLFLFITFLQTDALSFVGIRQML